MTLDLESRVRDRTADLEEANQRLRDEAISLAAAEESRGSAHGRYRTRLQQHAGHRRRVIGHRERQLQQDPAKAERFIANAMEGAQRGAQLTSRLLAFSRQQPLDPRPMDANALVRDMSDLLRRSFFCICCSPT